eukprot:TRINITY_DN17467_c0_g1_i1.p1 TRINITY_DN17467_c0_g1~~TRINITY_DN17467_c0_g1_i1.p1  ORF type:complete len:248 (-),score=45.66 TRINITY_DN17467_c0_g1_i1:68-724(-)
MQAKSPTGRSTPTLGRPGGSRPSVSGSVRGTSPTQRLTIGPVDDKNIITLSQLCTEDLDAKMREKKALNKMLEDLKRSKMQYDNKFSKKKKEVDSATVETMQMDKKLQAVNNSNRVTAAELAGIQNENERLRQDVEALRANLSEVLAAYERECEEIESLKQTLQSTRKELMVETKQRDIVQQDLRASRTAQTLMVHRLDDIERRNRVLKTCVANTINS